jgi:hypothetical protein
MRKTCDSSIETKHPTNGGEKGTRWKDPSPGKMKSPPKRVDLALVSNHM